MPYQFLLLVAMLPMFWSDIKHREVNMLWLLLLLLSVLAYSFLITGVEIAIHLAAINIALLSTLALGVGGYYYLTKRLEDLKSSIGIGDLIFLAILTPLFDIYSFLYFLIASFALGILWWLASYLLKCRRQTIPFISVTIITFFIYLLYTSWVARRI